MPEELKHIGIPRRSGRYPWGSGKDPQQRNPSLMGQVDKLRKEGMTDVVISKGLGINTSTLRRRKAIAKIEKFNEDSAFATRLKDKGMSNAAISKRMGINDHTVASLLDPVMKERVNATMKTAEILRKAVDEKRYVDIGLGTEISLNVSNVKLKDAVFVLTEKGYKVQTVPVEQPGTGKNTTMKALIRPDVTNSELYLNRNNIHRIGTVTVELENGERQNSYGYKINNLDSKRVKVRYDEEGGGQADGLIELRRGVEDISIGQNHYAQVRIGIDGTHYMKGMAVYSDDIPKGYDVIYNVNKKSGAVKDKVFKPYEKDPDNPFGSSIVQKEYTDSNGKKKMSVVNIVGYGDHPNEEGAWGDWSKSLSSQVLSKQLPSVAKKQLDLAYGIKKDEYDELLTLTNPAVKKRLLESFADDCDSASVHLKAAALPRQASQVLIPLRTIKDTEVYAPNYDHGSTVVLIRHPHGGIFEIPELTVNNNNAEGIKRIGKSGKDFSVDAVGINSKVASKLSGADFDGDAVLVIPNKSGIIKTAQTLRTLQEFNTKEYHNPSLPKLTDKSKQRLMGEASNLITDMTVKGANPDEIARAVRHSMVVIDAQKHGLDYKQSAIDHNIAGLKKKYQGRADGGAATLISRAASEQRIALRKDQTSIDPKTGKLVYKYITNQYRVNAKGRKVVITADTPEEAAKIGKVTYLVDRKKVLNPLTGKKEYVALNKELNPLTGKKEYVPITKVVNPLTGKTEYTGMNAQKFVERQSKSTKMMEVSDARELLSGPTHTGTVMERVYADHANALKDLANKARLAYLKTEDIPYSHSASVTYKKEVESLNAKLNNAFRNKPLERDAIRLANKEISAKRQSNPDIEPAALKKIKGQSLTRARDIVGAKKEPIVIEDREWEAIQSGAVSKNKLYNMLLNTKVETLKARALPRTFRVMSPAKLDRARTLLQLGHTTAEIAEMLGVSTNALKEVLK